MSAGLGIDHVLGLKRPPWEYWRQWHNNEALRSSLIDPVKRSLVAVKVAQVAQDSHDSKLPQKQTILNLALARTLQDKEPERVGWKETMDVILADLKLMLFAGHDTTSSTLCWMFKLLQDNPACLARLRAEHDAVLGPDSDPAKAAEVLRANPHLLNKLPYTHGVAKETLRLHPIA
jgi:cytochrome P450